MQGKRKGDIITMKWEFGNPQHIQRVKEICRAEEEREKDKLKGQRLWRVVVEWSGSEEFTVQALDKEDARALAEKYVEDLTLLDNLETDYSIEEKQ